MSFPVARVIANAKAAFALARSANGSRTMKIVRQVITGGSDAKGIEGTATDTGISGVLCVMKNASQEEIVKRGLQSGKSYRKFVAYDLKTAGGATFTAVLTDKILSPESSSTDYHNIVKVETFSTGRVEIFAALEKE